MYSGISIIWMIKMQKINRIFLVSAVMVLFLLLTVFSACKEKGSGSADALDSDTSYAFGMLMANQLMGEYGMAGLHFDYKAFSEGFMDYYEANETNITQEKAVELINMAYQTIQVQEEEKLWLEGSKNREEGEAYLAGNAARSGVTTTASGLQY
jgi:FKBP-type peptidyl-prolyl cis-trans isomerase FklB